MLTFCFLMFWLRILLCIMKVCFIFVMMLIMIIMANEYWCMNLTFDMQFCRNSAQNFNEIFIRKELQSIQNWRWNKKFPCNDSLRSYSFWTFWSAEYFTIILIGRIQWKDYFYVSDSQWSKMCTLSLKIYCSI